MTITTLDVGSDEAPDGLLPVGRFPTWQEAQEYALVVVAKQRPCWLRQAAGEEESTTGDPGDFVLYAETEHALPVIKEFAQYEREQQEAHEDVTYELPQFPGAPWIAFLWVSVLASVAVWQNHHPGITARGSSYNLGWIEDGEWWRPFTALFLHADVHHLVGNIAFGAVLGVLVARSLGPLLGWCLVIASGVVGNMLTGWWMFPDAFRSVGASTAVFGALGLLTGAGVLTAFRAPSSAPWASVVLPVGGAVGLLGWLGAGGPDTDVLGHLNGFFSGVVLGFFTSWWRHRIPPAA